MDSELVRHLMEIKEQLARSAAVQEATQKDITEVKSDFQHYRREARAEIAEIKESQTEFAGAITFGKWAFGVLLGLPAVAYAAGKLFGLIQ
jgi:hypothetical protein